MDELLIGVARRDITPRWARYWWGTTLVSTFPVSGCLGTADQGLAGTHGNLDRRAPAGWTTRCAPGDHGCHPMVLGSQSMAISSDYCGYPKDALEEGDTAGTVLFGESGHGDVDPRVCVQESESAARKMGWDLAAIVRAATPDLQPLAIGGQSTAARASLPAPMSSWNAFSAESSWSCPMRRRPAWAARTFRISIS